MLKRMATLPPSLKSTRAVGQGGRGVRRADDGVRAELVPSSKDLVRTSAVTAQYSCTVRAGQLTEDRIVPIESGSSCVNRTPASFPSERTTSATVWTRRAPSPNLSFSTEP